MIGLRHEFNVFKLGLVQMGKHILIDPSNIGPAVYRLKRIGEPTVFGIEVEQSL